MKFAWNRKSSVLFAFVLVAFILSATWGCKEDEKKEEAPAAPEESSSEEPQEGSAQPATSGKSKPSSARTPSAPPAPASVLEAPSDLVMYGGFRGFDDAVSVAGSVISQMGASAMPAEGLGEIVLQGVQAELGLKSMNWLDRKRSVSFGVWMGDNGDASSAILVPVVGKDALEAAFPDTVKKNVDGNDYQLLLMGEVAYGNVVSGYLVVSQHADRMSKSKSFIEKDLATYQPQGSCALHLSAGMLTSKFESEFAELKKEMAKELAEDQMIPGLTEVAVEQVNFLFDLIESVEWLSITAQMKGVHALVSLEVNEKKGKEALSVLTTHFTGRSPEVYKRLPQSSYLVIGGNLNPKAGLSWGKESMKALGDLLGLSDEESKTLNGHMDGMLDNGSGDMGIALYSTGKYPMAVSVVSGMRDGMAYRKDLLAVTDFAWKKAISVFGDEFKSDLPPGFNLDSFSGAVNSVGPLLAPMGVSIAITQDTSTEGVIVDSLTIKADIKKLLPDGQADPDMTEILNVVGDTMSLSMGYGKNATAIVLSPNAPAEAKALVSNASSSGHKGLEEVKANGVPGANFIVYTSVIDALRAFASIPDVKPILQQLGDASPGNGMGLSFGMAGKSAFRMDLDIPVDHLLAVVRAVRGVPF